jgi:DNA-binding MarR family transcriptional regulator
MTRDDRLIYRLFMAQQKLRTHIGNALAAEGVRVTLGQTGILFLLLENDGQTMTELSKALAVENPTLTGLVDRLERAGFVTRAPNPSDRRSYRIHITAEGIEERDKALPIIKRMNEEIKSGFSQDEIEVFKRVLNSMVEKFNQS